MKKMIQIGVFAVITLISSIAFSYEYRQEDLIIKNPWVYETASDQRDAPVYMSIRNLSRYDDVLLSASTQVADRVEFHSTDYRNGIPYMNVLSRGIYIDANSQTVLRSDGDHLMLINLRRQLNRGDAFYLRLNFRDAGSVSLRVTVESPRFYDKYYHYFYYLFNFDHHDRDRDRDRDWDRGHRDDDHRGRRDDDHDERHFHGKTNKDQQDQGPRGRDRQDHRHDQSDQGQPSQAPRDQGQREHAPKMEHGPNKDNDQKKNLLLWEGTEQDGGQQNKEPQ